MSAGTEAGRTLAGHTRVSTQALTTTAQGVAGEVLGVPPELVRADWRDDSGSLALSLSLPVGIPALGRVVADPRLVAGFDGTVRERVQAAKGRILDRIARLSGSALSRVDIRVTGVRIREGGRVR
jgi:hypothetical protein